MKETHNGTNRRAAPNTDAPPTNGTPSQDAAPAATTTLCRSESRREREGRLSGSDVGILGLMGHRLDP